MTTWLLVIFYWSAGTKIETVPNLPSHDRCDLVAQRIKNEYAKIFNHEFQWLCIEVRP